MEITAGRTCCHLFGGRATFGTRIDIDPIVRPHVIADAWMPPFAMNAFDVVILDPPYVGINQQMKDTLDILIHHGKKVLDSFGNIDPRLVNDYEAQRDAYDKKWGARVLAFKKVVKIKEITRAQAEVLKLV